MTAQEHHDKEFLKRLDERESIAKEGMTHGWILEGKEELRKVKQLRRNFNEGKKEAKRYGW